MLTTEEKVIAAAAHLSYLVGLPIAIPLLIYVWKRDSSPFIADHAKQAAGCHIIAAIAGIALFIVFIVLMGTLVDGGAILFLVFLPFLALSLVMMILTVIAALRSGEGKSYTYPLFGHAIRRL